MLLSTFRVLANGLDLLGILGIAILASTFGAFASNSGGSSGMELPLVGALYITELKALLIASLVAAIFVLKSGFAVWLNLRTSMAVAAIESKLSNQLAEGFFRISKFENHDSVSDFQNKAVQSTVGIRLFLNSRVTLTAEVALVASMVLVFSIINPIATGALTAFMGLVLTILNRLIRVRVVRNSRAQVAGNQKSLEAAKDLYGVRREAQTAGILERWIAKFRSGRSQMAYGGALTYTLNSLPRFVIETSLIMGIFLFIGGVVLFSDISSQAVTIGVFLAGGLRIIAAVIPLQAAITQMQSGAAQGQIAFETLERLSQQKEDVGLSIDPSTSVGISFQGVSYSYSDSDESVLKDVSFDVEPLTKVAIVGPSGAGKSTIFDLAMGFLVPTRGKVLIGDQAARSVLSGSPGTFGIVPQRPHLVSGNILENVSLLSNEETDVNRVKEVLIRAGLETLTRDYKWHSLDIRPDFGQFSGGEIQRLSLARALYSNPKILLLDEATSALDAGTELEITKVLDELGKEMTIFLIAHRLSTVSKADKIIYLDNGQIVAQGNFSELKAEVEDFATAIKIMGLEN